MHSRHRTPSRWASVARVGRGASLAAALLVSTHLLAEEIKRSFKIEPGDAESTLKMFSEQAGLGVIFSTDAVRDVRTNPVRGDLPAKLALEKMLEGTPLVVIVDERSGAFAVRRTERANPNGHRATEEIGRPNVEPARATTADKEAVVTLEAFVATGSNIKRIDQEKALPVTTFTREQIDAREASTPVALLSALPQVVNVPLTENLGYSSVSAPGDNASISLRGAGSGNTLILLNSRRLVPHPLSSIEEASVPSMSVNISQLPNRGIDRIDVLRDGASSIYGTDAVAGVVNYIMNRDLRGTEVSTRLVAPEDGGGFEQRGTLSFGRDFAKGKGRLITVLDVFNRDDITVRDRDFSRYLDKTAEAPPIWRTANTGVFFNSATSPDYGTQSYTFGSMGASGTWVAARPSYATSFTASSQASFGRFYLVPKTGGMGFKSSAASRTDAAEKAFYTNEAQTGFLQNRSSRINWFTQAEFDITETLTAFGELGYYRALSKNPYQGNTATFTAGTSAVAYSNPPLVIAADNPWNPFGSRFYHPTGAANSDGTPRAVGTPSALLVNNAKLEGIPGSSQEVTTDVYRVLGGLRGRWSGSWTWESAILGSRSIGIDDGIDNVRSSVLRDAIASGRLNPFGYTFQVVNGAVTVKDKYVNRASDFPGLLDKRSRRGETGLASIDFRSSGTLFDLWGNDVGFSGGAEFRGENYSNTYSEGAGLPPEGSTLYPYGSDYVGQSPVSNTKADRTVGSAYVEVLVPFVAPAQKIAGINLLEFGASARSEYYSDFGSTTKPKVSLNWRPTPWIMVRTSYNEGFRAPNLAVLYSSDMPRQRTVSDPYRLPVTNNALLDNTSRGYTLIANRDLQPEESKGKSLGMVVDVPVVKGLSFSVDYWEIDQRGVIVSPFLSLPQDDYTALAAETQRQLAAGIPIDQVNLGSGTSSYKGAVGMVRQAVTDEDRAYFAAYNATRTAANQLGVVGQVSYLISQYQNRSKGYLSGYDFGANYNLPNLPVGRFSVGTDWAYVHDLYYQLNPGDPVDEVRYDNPRLRGSVNLSWRKGSWSAALAGYYTGHYLSTTAFLTESQYADPSAASSRGYLQEVIDSGTRTFRYIVDDLWTYNASASYRIQSPSTKWLKGTRIRLGVANLTNEEPPLTDSGFSRTVNSNVLAGRTWSLELSKNF